MRGLCLVYLDYIQLCRLLTLPFLTSQSKAELPRLLLLLPVWSAPVLPACLPAGARRSCVFRRSVGLVREGDCIFHLPTKEEGPGLAAGTGAHARTL